MAKWVHVESVFVLEEERKNVEHIHEFCDRDGKYGCNDFFAFANLARTFGTCEMRHSIVR